MKQNQIRVAGGNLRLEDRLRECEDAVALYWRRHGVSPTGRDIGRMVGISYEYVRALMPQLLHDGRVIRVSGQYGFCLPGDAEHIRQALRGKPWRNEAAA